MRSNISPAKDQAGVALIEVLVSILLFSLGVLGLIGLQARAVSFSVDAEDRNRAALLANEAASLMWLHKSVTLPAAELEAWQDSVADAKAKGLPNAEGTVTAISGTTNSAEIKITWHAPSRDAQEQDSQLVTRVTLP